MAFCHTQAIIRDTLEGVTARRTLGGYLEIEVGPRAQEYSPDEISRLIAMWETAYSPSTDLEEFFEGEFGSVYARRVASFFANHLTTIENLVLTSA